MSFLGDYTQCPFDKSHRIIRSRLQTHLVKCAKNYPGVKLVCIYDASHKVDPQNYENHLKECESSGNMKCYEYSMEPAVTVGTIPIESACNVESTTMNDEDWSGDNPTYDPWVASEKKNVLRTGVGLSKGQRKKHKQLERERVAKLGDHDNSKHNISSVEQSELETPLRVPKKAIKALSCDSNSLNNVTNRICYNEIISKLEKVSMEESMENARSEKESVENIFNNTFNEKSNRSVNLKNVSLCEDKEEMNTSAIRQTTFEAKINTSELKNDSSLKISKENKVKKNISYQNLNEKKTTCLNPSIAATFYQQAKKISTGRGFTIAYQKARDNQEVVNTSENFYSIYGYDEDKSDDNDTAVQNK
ncbi:uncharacterized protein LOC122402892 [Colletes gigas]|uniref:uncharacterized protein LOC122402892 n=1 Tax=Colletes gigas TaxID=935657 RepID=UPI001C9B8952|nr:uncharacterized protein LOC122402892 [Colletes gigas]